MMLKKYSKNVMGREMTDKDLQYAQNQIVQGVDKLKRRLKNVEFHPKKQLDRDIQMRILEQIDDESFWNFFISLDIKDMKQHEIRNMFMDEYYDNLKEKMELIQFPPDQDVENREYFDVIARFWIEKTLRKIS